MVAQQQNKGDPDVTKKMEKVKGMKHFPPYGSMDENTTGDNCPTCRGTGRIPRGWPFFCEEKSAFICLYCQFSTVLTGVLRL